MGRVVGSVLVAAWKVFRTNLQIATTAIKIIVGALKSFVKQGLETGRKIRAVADAIAGAFKGIANRVVDAFKGVPDKLKEQGKNAASGFLKGFKAKCPAMPL